MIAFDLQCVNGHSFEGWFEDLRSFEEQEKRDLIACPVCDETSVYRIPSTFAIKSSKAVKDFAKQRAELEDIGKRIVNFLEKNFDDVGSDFAKEALKMHYGVTEPRNIKGSSTEQEEETLKEEGIQFFKIPLPSSSETDA
jgi:hypothetical protein